MPNPQLTELDSFFIFNLVCPNSGLYRSPQIAIPNHRKTEKVNNFPGISETLS